MMMMQWFMLVLPSVGGVWNYSSEATVVCAGERAVCKEGVGVLMSMRWMILIVIGDGAMTGGGGEWRLFFAHEALPHVLFVRRWWGRRREAVRGDGRRRDRGGARAGREVRVRVRVRVVHHPPQVGTTGKRRVQLRHVLQRSSRRLV